MAPNNNIKSDTLEKSIKIVLSISLFICLLKMPYGYYQLVRFMALVGFVLLAVLANKRGGDIEMVIFIALALLFQPFIKVALGRPIWNIVDIIVGISLLLSFFLLFQKREHGKRN